MEPDFSQDYRTFYHLPVIAFILNVLTNQSESAVLGIWVRS